ncbi:MAG: 50S ribosomal protein L21 [Cyanobacteria bacterium P01_H01_bin.74]
MTDSQKTAIIDLNGKQYKVTEGRYLLVDRLPMDIDVHFEIANILLLTNGNETKIGAPYIEGAKVNAKVLKHERSKKILVYKMRCKKGYRRKRGHRQDLTRIQIESVVS